MIKSGLIFGAVTFLLVLLSAIIVSPLCAPCLGLFIGLGAGYCAGVFDKPNNSGDSVKKGAIAGAIAGGIGIIGGLIGAVINGALVNPASLQTIYEALGITGVTIDKTNLWVGQLTAAVCVGLFDVVWMAILGVAGGALWFQITGKNQIGVNMPPQAPLPPER
jgi:hypothetical protein